MLDSNYILLIVYVFNWKNEIVSVISSEIFDAKFVFNG